MDRWGKDKKSLRERARDARVTQEGNVFHVRTPLWKARAQSMDGSPDSASDDSKDAVTLGSILKNLEVKYGGIHFGSETREIPKASVSHMFEGLVSAAFTDNLSYEERKRAVDARIGIRLYDKKEGGHEVRVGRWEGTRWNANSFASTDLAHDETAVQELARIVRDRTRMWNDTQRKK